MFSHHAHRMGVLKQTFCSPDLFAQEKWKLAVAVVAFPGKSDFLPVPRPLSVIILQVLCSSTLPLINQFHETQPRLHRRLSIPGHKGVHYARWCRHNSTELCIQPTHRNPSTLWLCSPHVNHEGNNLHFWIRKAAIERLGRCC